MEEEKVISDEELRKVISLSGLKEDESSFSKLAEDINSIIGYIKTLNSLDTDQVQETAHIQESFNVMREDEVIESMSEEDIRLNAPDIQGPYFKVPLIVG